MTLRSYQRDAVTSAVTSINNNMLKSMIVIPTGGGKTLIIKSIVDNFHRKQILIITPRKRLLQQTVKYIDGAGVMSGNIGDDDGSNHNVVIGTYQTLIKRDFKEPELIIIDEVHMVPYEQESEYKKLLDKYNNVPILGLTATPFWKNKPLLDFDWNCIHETTITSLIEQKYLVPPRSIGIGQSQLNSHSEESIESITSSILPDLLKSFDKQGIKSPMIFCANIDHAIYVIQRLNKYKRKCVLIHSKLSSQTIDKRWSVYEKGDHILVNVLIATMGIDVPRCDGIVLLRNIVTYSLFTQIVGRGLRPYKTKTHCCIYDFGEASKKFYDLLLTSDKSSVVNSQQTVKTCPVCETQTSIQSQRCQYCGYQYKFCSHLQLKSQTQEILGPNYQYATAVSVNNTHGIWVVELSDATQAHSKIEIKVGQTLLVKMKTKNLKDIITIAS